MEKFHLGLETDVQFVAGKWMEGLGEYGTSSVGCERYHGTHRRVDESEDWGLMILILKVWLVVKIMDQK